MADIFRKKSIDRISSPEQLNEYICVSNPTIWSILLGIFLLLTGALVWSITGKLNTVIYTAVIVGDHTATLLIPESEIELVQTGMELTVNETNAVISRISETPMQVTTEINAYALHIGDLSENDWVYTAVADISLEDGVYQAKIVAETVSPISFLFN